MHDKNDLYEYAVIRLVPRVEREEFINVGLAMLCKRKDWLKMDYHLNADLLEVFCPETEKAFVDDNLKAFKEIARGSSTDSPIAKLKAAERFRWLTAVRSSVIQTSRPHVGKTEHLEKTFSRLFEELVL